MDKEIIIYHGSHIILKEPIYGVGNPYNDYGLGFYCTYSLDLAKEWACDAFSGGYANKYKLNTNGLKILNLNSKEYSIINWISVLLKNRKVTLSTDIEIEAMNYILDNFNVNTDDYDIIIGYRADDSYFSYARDFLSNTITVKRLLEAMRLGNLGNQIVIKSKLAFSRLEFIGYEEAPQEIHYPLRKKRDELARVSYRNSKKSIETSKDSLYIIDIIREEIKGNDPRIQ